MRNLGYALLALAFPGAWLGWRVWLHHRDRPPPGRHARPDE